MDDAIELARGVTGVIEIPGFRFQKVSMNCSSCGLDALLHSAQELLRLIVTMAVLAIFSMACAQAQQKARTRYCSRSL